MQRPRIGRFEGSLGRMNGRLDTDRKIVGHQWPIGLHRLSHDEVYYVLSGRGEVASDGMTQRLAAGMAAYLFAGAEVGIKQMGDEPLALIISYPNPSP